MTSGGTPPSHPFAECTAELCHAAQISPEAEPYAVQYINYVLIRIVQQKNSEIHETLRAALEDLAADKINEVETPIDAKQFNEIGIAAKTVQLNSCSILLWWLVCIIEWQSGHRIFLSFMRECSRGGLPIPGLERLLLGRVHRLLSIVPGLRAAATSSSPKQ